MRPRRLGRQTAALALGWPGVVAALGPQAVDAPPAGESKDRHEPSLGELITKDLEFDGWFWAGGLHNNDVGDNSIFDLELSLAVLKSFNQRVAIGTQVNLIDANDERRVELGSGYVSARPFEEGETIVTIGKFNANFGVEPRDIWNRRTGTTSALFGAQPQDLLGLMVTQPIGETGLTVRPFMTNDFQTAWTLDQPPAAGVQLEYAPDDDLRLSFTNWVGPGYVVRGGRELVEPYPQGAYGEGIGGIVGNWQGPNLVAERAGTLYYVQVAAEWRPRRDLALSAEYLMGSTNHNGERWGWAGWMVMADYSITDSLHAYARYTFLDDSDWITTGIFHHHKEFSVGAGYVLLEGLEVRGEFRYDDSTARPDVETLSLHLIWSF